MEAYVELLIAAYICFNGFEIWKAWNGWDWFSTGVHMTAIGVVIVFFFFVCWFVFVKVVPLNHLKNKERLEKYADKIQETQSNFS